MVFFRGIARKLVLSFIFISVVPVLIFVYFALRNAENALEEQTVAWLENVITVRLGEVERFLEDKKGTAASLSNSPLLVPERLERVVTDPVQAGTIRVLLRSILVADRDFLEVAIVDPSGIVQISTSEKREQKSASFSLEDTQPGIESRFSRIFEDSRAGNGKGNIATVLTASIGEGENSWVLGATIDLSRMRALIREPIGPGSHGTIYLVDTAQIFVTEPEALSDLFFTRAALSFSCVPDMQRNGRARDYAGNAVVGVVQWFPLLRVCAVSEIATSQAFVSLRAFQFVMGLITALEVLFVIGLGFFLSLAVVRPIRVLQQGAERIGEGKFDARIALKTRDELQELAEGFNSMAQRLKEAHERDIFLNRLKGEFLSVVAHQLRTPLTGLKWSLATIREEFTKLALPPELLSLMYKAERSNNRMIRLVSDLLDTMRVEEGKFGYLISPGRLDKIVERIVLDFSGYAESRNIDMEYQPPREPFPFVSFDEQKITIVVQNLLENALAYTLPGGKITVSVGESDTDVICTIADSGVGIPSAEQSMVFTKFFRATNVVRLETEGSGLGLYLAKNIIEGHHGKMWFSSGEGKGATFSISIPKDAQHTVGNFTV